MKSKINFKFLNVLLVLLILYLFYLLSPLWWSAIKKIFYALLPIIIGFSIAFIFNPLVTFSEKKLKIPRVITAIIIYIVALLSIILIVFFVIKPVIDDMPRMIDGINIVLTEFGELLNVDASSIIITIDNWINSYITTITNFFTASEEGANQVISFVISLFVTIVVGIIFLTKFDNIKDRAKLLLVTREKKETLIFYSRLYHDLKKYIVSEIFIAAIQFVEYVGLFLIISIFNQAFLDYVLLIGLFAALFSLIPYFGGYLSGLSAILIAVSLPNPMYSMIGIVIFLLIFPNLDAYLINPMVYKKRIELSPVVTIGGILIFSSLFGVIGVIISIPILLVLSVAYNVYKDFLKTKVQQFKESF